LESQREYSSTLSRDHKKFASMFKKKNTNARSAQKRKYMALVRKRIEQEQQELLKHANTCFLRLFSDAEVIEENQVQRFLADVLRKSSEELDPDAVQLVIENARLEQEEIDVGVIKKEAIMKSTGKYAEYIDNSQVIDQLFITFDFNNDNVLSPEELKCALQDYETKRNRDAEFTEEEVNFVLEMCDANKDGNLGRSEVLPFLAKWEELAVSRAAEEQKCCVM